MHAKDEFIEYEGALFKKKRGGGYHEVVFCPLCRAPMCFFVKNYICDWCQITFTLPKKVPDILKELPDGVGLQ